MLRSLVGSEMCIRDSQVCCAIFVCIALTSLFYEQQASRKQSHCYGCGRGMRRVNRLLLQMESITHRLKSSFRRILPLGGCRIHLLCPPFCVTLPSLPCPTSSPRLASPRLALPCLALPCLALPCLALPCLALPCLARFSLVRHAKVCSFPSFVLLVSYDP